MCNDGFTCADCSCSTTEAPKMTLVDDCCDIFTREMCSIKVSSEGFSKGVTHTCTVKDVSKLGHLCDGKEDG